MRRIHVGAAALNQTPLDWTGNTQRIIHALQAARQEGIRLLCLPELCISGYGCEDAFFLRSTPQMALEQLAELIPHTHDLVTCIGLPLLLNDQLYNAAALCVDGRLHSFYAKQFLAGEGIHYEQRWFKPFMVDEDDFVHFSDAALEPADLDDLNEELGLPAGFSLPNDTFPVQTTPVAIEGIRIGFEICEDAWGSPRASDAYEESGVDIILNPSASHFSFGKSPLRRDIALSASRAHSCVYILANLLGNEAGRAIYDGDLLIAQNGHLLAQGRRFSFRSWGMVSAVVDVDAGKQRRRRNPNATALPSNHLEEPDSPRILGDQALPLTEPILARQDSKPEELYRAMTLGLWDYMRKSGSKGFVVSLSGGADSSACALFAARALQEAQAELSAGELLAAAPQLKDMTGEGWVSRLLTCVYQATENSSEATRHSARTLAEGLGANYLEWDVQPLFDQYTDMAAQAMGRALGWEQDDIALQNIQARLRAPGIWMLANLKGALLLATSNRSEVAVGYATMDGDTAGGLAPLGGLDKAYLLEWLQWAEMYLGLQSLAPLNALTPTAELRPADRNQTDEADLMPYPLLDAIEREAFVQGKSPLEVFQTLKTHGMWRDAQLRTAIRKFYTLWARNQWKRERYAPAFHLDTHNLDPRTWLRFPILSGGFEKELAALKGKGKE